MTRRQSIEIRRRIAYVGEDKGLYGYMTVAELIRFTRSFYSDWQPESSAACLLSTASAAPQGQGAFQGYAHQARSAACALTAASAADA